MQNRISYVVFALFSFVWATLSWPSHRSGSHSGEPGSSSGALAALFGGSSKPAPAREKSIFESDFWRTGVSDKAIPDEPGTGKNRDGEPDLLEPASAGNPINPETNQPYSDAVMEQFAELRKKFPNNSIIPRKRTEADIKAEEQERVEIYSLQAKVYQNQASAGDIDRFYDYQTKGIRDRLDLLNYVLEEQGSQMSPEIKSQYDKILTMNKNQLQSMEEARTRAKAQSQR